MAQLQPLLSTLLVSAAATQALQPSEAKPQEPGEAPWADVNGGEGAAVEQGELPSRLLGQMRDLGSQVGSGFWPQF